MNTTVEALKALYVAMGGTASDVENITLIPDMINAIASIAGSASNLPAVSADDNGDILQVVNGKWAKVAASKELPAVTDADNGSVLKVVDGAWAKGTDNIE
jgi:hypothetical protein